MLRRLKVSQVFNLAVRGLDAGRTAGRVPRAECGARTPPVAVFCVPHFGQHVSEQHDEQARPLHERATSFAGTLTGTSG
jgi:hypothetical protein